MVDRIYELEKDGPAFGMGHYIPDLWHRIFLDDRARPHHLAMLVFAEIWFRHRPLQSKKVQDNGDLVITMSKGFNDERYQFNRAEMAFRLNTSADAVSRVLTYLEKLGVIRRDHADTDFNHRGFRNIVYVTPIVEKLLELVEEASGNVNKDHPNEQIEENARKSERRDVGNVAPMMPVTSPTSSWPRGPHDPGDVAHMMGAVSRRSSETPSVSAVFAAQPQNHLETNNNKKSSAPQAAQPGAVDAAREVWEAPPPKPTGKGGTFGGPEEKVKAIRYQIGRSYRTWYGEAPELSAKEFEDLLLPVVQELKWKLADMLTVIRAGWLWAVDAPAKEDGKTFIPGFYSRRCDRNLRALFKRDRKENKLFLWQLQQELEAQAGDEYDLGFGNMTREDAELWWNRQMIDRRVIRDDSKYYDEEGREIDDPGTTWTGINRVVENWVRFNQPDAKPEQEWLEAVVERLKQQAGPPAMHRSGYEEVKKAFKKLGLIPADLK
ncbi:MAG: hypothetical protein ACLQM8_12310 [Limisphaerales bacterium]